jgi:hypothetical protein
MPDFNASNLLINEKHCLYHRRHGHACHDIFIAHLTEVFIIGLSPTWVLVELCLPLLQSKWENKYS